jgi:hypothetical protein
LASKDREVLQVLYRKANEFEEELIVNSKFYPEDKARVLQLFKDTNEFFGKTKAVKDFTSKLIGYNKEAGEKGFMGANKALDNLLQPNNFRNLDAVVNLMDKETSDYLKLGLVTKIFDNSMIENGSMLSLDKLQKNVTKYGEGDLRKVLGDDKIDRINDLMTGMQRARTYNLKFADPSNKSGTAASTIEKVFFGSGPIAAIAGFLNPAVWGAAAAGGVTAYANRLIAKVMTKQPVSKFESAVANETKNLVKGAPKTALKGAMAAKNASGSVFDNIKTGNEE